MANMLAPISMNAFTTPAKPGDIPLQVENNQNINPWSWMTQFSHNQFSMFTVNLGYSSAPEIEAEILENVGSYGRQIGRISDVIAVLVKHLSRGSLSEDELAAVEDFSSQMREIKRIKERRRS